MNFTDLQKSRLYDIWSSLKSSLWTPNLDITKSFTRTDSVGEIDVLRAVILVTSSTEI